MFRCLIGLRSFAALINELMEHEPEVIAIEDVGEEHLLLGAGKAAMRGKRIGTELTLFFELERHRGNHGSIRQAGCVEV